MNQLDNHEPNKELDKEPVSDEREMKHWEDALPRFSLNRRITVLVLMLSVLVIGAVATVGIPLELVPQGYEAPSLNVNVPWRDAPAREVLDKVVLPLEDELSTIGGLDDLSSRSTTGRARLFLSFKQGTDMDVAYREVRDRILRARPHLPDDVDRIEINKFNEASLPIMVLGVAIDPQVTDSYNLIQQEIILPLRRIDGVASVQSDGLQEKEVLIELDREKTAAANLNIFLIGRQLAGDNFSLASGHVRSGDRKLLLRSVSRYDTLEEIRDQLVTANVRLGDIADVRLDEPDQYWRVRVNGKPALAVEILKEGQANTIEVGERLRVAYEEIRSNPKLLGSDVEVLFSQSDTIQESLSTLIDSGQVGALFAVMVLLFFLRRFRLTLIITLAIPLSMVVALIAMYFAGETLNILSLLGLIISVGLLVDNSVVVAENIHRLHQEGMPRRDACIRGAGEIALAVVLATTTTIIVFLPSALVDGRAKFFLVRLAIPISVSLVASLVVALVLIPLCVYLTLPKRGSKTSKRAVVAVHMFMDRILGALYEITLEPLNRLYSPVLQFCLRHRFDLVIIVMTVLTITVTGPMKTLEIVEVSREDSKAFRIRVDLPSNFNLDDASEFFSSVEGVLEEVKDELQLEGYLVIHSAHWGRVQGWFPDQEELSRQQIIERLLKVLPDRPGIKYYSGTEDRQSGADPSIYSVVLNGEDPDALVSFARELEKRLVAVEGVVGIKRADDMTPNELGLVVDRDRAQRQGISPQVIAGVVATGLRGQPLPRYHDDGKEVPMRIRFQEEDRESLGELVDFSVPTGDGLMVRLGSLVDTRFLNASNGITRSDKRISHHVTVDLAEGEERETKDRLDALVAQIDYPEGITRGAQTAAIRLDDDVGAMRFAAMVSIVFIYLLMGFLFESFILPLSILLTIPLAAIGVVWTHYVAERDLDFLGFVGVLLLIGVVVNNGIVLVDYIGRLRSAGYRRAEAVILAARRRFRPIMMTAGTTICGMIPLTLGAPTSIGLSYKSFGLTLIGGMMTATALTLLVVPVFYTLFDDARHFVLSALARVWRMRS